MHVYEHTHTERVAHPFWYWGGLQDEGQREVWLGLILRSVLHTYTQTHTLAVVKQQLIMRSVGA